MSMMASRGKFAPLQHESVDQAVSLIPPPGTGHQVSKTGPKKRLQYCASPPSRPPVVGLLLGRVNLRRPQPSVWTFLRPIAVADNVGIGCTL